MTIAELEESKQYAARQWDEAYADAEAARERIKEWRAIFIERSKALEAAISEKAGALSAETATDPRKDK